MRVLIYVEGPSDRFALETLLRPVITDGQRNRVGIKFIALDGKASILNDSPRKAADHIKEHPEDWVFALPDLYPMSSYDGTPNQHRSFPDLDRLLKARFVARADRIGLPPSRTHFRVHCLKHDLEALLLAAPDALRARLKTDDALRGKWIIPVENQNDDKPPKRIVEMLFKKYRKKRGYVETVDAPAILKNASFEAITVACSQRFAAFVAELRTLANGDTLP